MKVVQTQQKRSLACNRSECAHHLHGQKARVRRSQPLLHLLVQRLYHRVVRKRLRNLLQKMGDGHPDGFHLLAAAPAFSRQ